MKLIEAVIFIFLSGCIDQKSNSHTEEVAKVGRQHMEQEALKARFELVSGVLEVDVSTLETIRKSVVAFLRSPNEAFKREYFEFREQFLQELENADCVIGADGSARIDAWILERNTDSTGVILVRHPPRTAVMYLFYANLIEKSEREWIVTSFEHRRVSALR